MPEVPVLPPVEVASLLEPVAPPVTRTVPAFGTAGESVKSVSRSRPSARAAPAAKARARRARRRMRAFLSSVRRGGLHERRQGGGRSRRSQGAHLPAGLNDEQPGRRSFFQLGLEDQPARPGHAAEVLIGRFAGAGEIVADYALATPAEGDRGEPAAGLGGLGAIKEYPIAGQLGLEKQLLAVACRERDRAA